ncbi:hypothetical protein ABRP95_09675 [Corynebacterium sp. KPL2895]|uniref:hypothetical protein n=1 Tax=Corynebacterium sp. KPL2895 TaxID=3158320 RepID=UPI0032EDFE01
MTVDQQDLANAAKKLQVLYGELDHAKYERPPAPEVSTQGANQQKGPSEPFPIWTISDDAHFTALLNEYCDDAARYVPLAGDIYTHGFRRNGRRMCQWIAWNAGPISQLDVAPLMLDELRHQARELNHRLRRTRPLAPVTLQSEPRRGAEHIARQLRARGQNVTADTIRGWARRGHITTTTMPNGRNGYLLTEALTHTWKE